MAVPKRKVSKGRRDRRRAHHALQRASTGICPQCGVSKLPHRACPACGFYQGRQVISIREGKP